MSASRILLIVADEYSDSFQSHFVSKGFQATFDKGVGDVYAQLFNSQLEGNPYTHLLVDLTLSHVDMAALAEQIRADPILRDMKLMVASPDNRGADAEMMLMCGFNEIFFYSLLDVNASFLDQEEDEVSKTPQVMIVGEDPATSKVTKFVFNKYQIKSYEFNTWEEARNRINDAVYDLIVIDCDSSGMDGYEVAFEVRSFEGRLSTVPIVGITAGRKGEIPRPVEVGMTEILKKPIIINKFRDVLKGLLPEWKILHEV